MGKKVIVAGLALLVLGYGIYLIGSVTRSPEKGNGIRHVSGEYFIGSESCKSCHATIYNSFVSTAHYLTSRPAEEKFIKGKFEKPGNEYVYNDADKVVLEKYDSGLYQVGYTNGRSRGAQRFDIVVGSGTKGQTYLHWIGNKLVQLPVSYYVPDSMWSSSPGYPPDRFLINRPITSQCLDCHSTYFEVHPKLGQAEEFDRNRIMYGIDCERCHGPAARHVTYHTTYPTEKKGKFIINAVSLNRRQQLDACGLCHSSIQKNPKLPFSFTTGDSLRENYMSLDRGDTTSQAEVHGNQYGLLTLSKCYLKSDDLNCSSCHNPHQKERGNLALISSRCMNCHRSGDQKKCGLTARLGKALESNCIDCHMPVNESAKIIFRVSGKKQLTPEKVRTHYIKVYPEEARKIEAEMAKLGKL